MNAATSIDAPALAGELERRMATLVLRTLRDSFSELSRTGTSTLALLRDVGPSRVTDLATSQAVAQPTMTTLLLRLESEGLVARGVDPDDGRAVRVAITADGEALLQRARAARADALEARFAHLGAADRRAVEAVLPVLDKLIATEEDPRV
jgi:DNA-binding MarR family transcriptional regulator